MKELLHLFWVFAKIGAVTFGGGYAMLPILTRRLVDELHWTTDEELTNYFAIGQCTPGVIAVNVATFIGNKKRGIIGGIFATLGMVSAPLVIISIIAAFLSNFAEYKIVKDAFAGIRICVCVLILNAVTRLWKKSVVDKFTFVLFALVFIISAFGEYFSLSLSPVIMVIACALIGIIKCNLSIKNTHASGDKKGGKSK